MEFKDELKKYTERLENIKDTSSNRRGYKNVSDCSFFSASWI